MKKLAIAITSLLLMTGCSSTPTITNTNNIGNPQLDRVD